MSSENCKSKLGTTAPVFQSWTLMLRSVDKDVEQQEGSLIAARNAQGVATSEEFGLFFKS